MFKGCWFLVIAIGLTTLSDSSANDTGCQIVGGLAKCENARYPDRISDDAKGRTEQSEAPFVSGIDQKGKPESANNKPDQPCGRENYDPSDRNCRDLLAQEKMATWTARLGWIGAFSILLLAGTLIANTWAVVATRRIGQAQTQGYLFLDKAYFDFSAPKFAVAMLIINHGKTIALDCFIEYTVELIETGDPGQTFQEIDIHGIFDPVAPGKRERSLVILDSADAHAWELLDAARLTVLIKGKLSWRTVFGNTDTSEFRVAKKDFGRSSDGRVELETYDLTREKRQNPD